MLLFYHICIYIYNTYYNNVFYNLISYVIMCTAKKSNSRLSGVNFYVITTCSYIIHRSIAHKYMYILNTK